MRAVTGPAAPQHKLQGARIFGAPISSSLLAAFAADMSARRAITDDLLLVIDGNVMTCRPFASRSIAVTVIVLPRGVKL
jgi:hypothetical protein